MVNEPETPVANPSGHSAFRIQHSAFISAMVGLALYAVTLGGTWVFDDIFHLFNDARTQVEEARPGRPPPEYDRPAIEDPRQWGRYLTESYNDGIDNLYRPVTSLSFAAQATLHGRRDEVAWAWHLVNVLLYGVVCAQVALLAGRLARDEIFERADDPALRVAQEGPGRVHDQLVKQNTRGAAWVALCAGLLFATHPVHVEVVAGIVGRAELFCAVGFLGALLIITRPLTPARIAAFVALMFLSIGGKEQGLVLPAVALVWYLSRRWAGLPSLTRRVRLSSEAGAAELPGEPGEGGSLSYESPRSGRTDDLGKILLIAVALPLAGYLILREQVLKLSMAWPVNLLDPTIQTMRDAAGPDRWLMPVALAGRYLHLLVWPNRLSIDYGASVIEPPQRLDDLYLWLGVLAILLFAAAAVHALRAGWAAGLTLLAGFAATYGVVSNIPTIIGTVFGERLLFLPSAFFVMYVVLLVRRISDCLAWQRSYLPRVAIILVLVISCLGAVRSFTYAAKWSDRLSFYEYQARVQPESVRIWMLLAEELRQRGRLEEAAIAAERATEVEPHYWDGWIIRTMVARDRGRLQEALEYAERAVAERTSIRTTVLRGEIDRLIAQQREAATQPSTGRANP